MAEQDGDDSAVSGAVVETRVDGSISYAARWLLFSQQCSIEPLGIQLRQTSRWGLRSVDTLIPFTELAEVKRRLTGEPSPFWLVGAGAMALGVISNLITRDELWIGNVLLGSAISAFLAYMWKARRIPLWGLPPLMLVDQGDRTRAFLSAVLNARAEHIVTRIAEHDLTAAFRLINEWRTGGLISADEATRLWRLVESRSPGADGYL